MHQLKRTSKFYKGFKKPDFNWMGFMCFFFFFLFERNGTVLCSWLMMRGTNTLTGWDGTELLICAVWISLYICVSLAGKVGHQLLLFFPSVLYYLAELYSLGLYLWLRYVSSFTSQLCVCVELILPSYVWLLCFPITGKLFTLHTAVAPFKWKCSFKWLGNK